MGTVKRLLQKIQEHLNLMNISLKIPQIKSQQYFCESSPNLQVPNQRKHTPANALANLDCKDTVLLLARAEFLTDEVLLCLDKGFSTPQ